MTEYLPMPPEDRQSLQEQLALTQERIWDVKSELNLLELARAALMNVLKGEA